MTRNLSSFAMVLLLFLGTVEVRQSLVLAQDRPNSTSRQVKRRLMPEYPEVAKRMNLTGKVRLAIVIAPDGHVKLTRPLGGHPVLVQSAENAVKDWKFSADVAETIQVVEMEFAGTEVH